MSTAVEQMAHYCNKYAVFCMGANGHGECNTTACWNNKAGVRKVRLIDADALPIDIDYHDVEDAPTIGGWIPCSKRLPKEDGRYLVTSTKWGELETTIDVFYNGDWIGDVKPIAWQPLSEPYKEQKGRSE